MGLFSRKIAADDLKRVDRLEEQVESLTRRLESVMVDLDEFYAKVNKARQRVVKEDRDAARGAGSPLAVADGGQSVSREALKAQLRERIRSGRA